MEISMIYLTLSALKYAANICEEISHYRVCIVVSDMLAVKNLVDVIGMNMRDNNAEFRTAKSNILIVFSNKSTIDIFSSDISHCKKANLIIVDDRIDKEILRSVFIHTLSPIESFSSKVEDSDEESKDYLRGFRDGVLSVQGERK